MSSSLKVGIDVDDVIADLLTPWLARYNKETGTNWIPADLTQWDLAADLGSTHEAIHKHLTPDIYKEVLPFPGALQAVIDIVGMGHDVSFVSSCPDIDHYGAKEEWLARHGFAGPHTELLGVGAWSVYKSKADTKVDWLVDDHIGNLETFPGYKLLMSRPHNHRLACDYKRVKSLKDVVDILNFFPTAQSPKMGPLPIRHFATGATRDTDQGKFDYEGFLSPVVLKRFAEFMHKNRVQSDGSLRASDNWQKGIPQEAYVKSLIRHVVEVWSAWDQGRVDQDAACAIIFNTNGLIYEELKPKAA